MLRLNPSLRPRSTDPNSLKWRVVPTFQLEAQKRCAAPICRLRISARRLSETRRWKRNKSAEEEEERIKETAQEVGS